MDALREQVTSWLRRLRNHRAERQPHPRVPILTYHSAKSLGYTYDSNDHRALEADLRLIRSMGFHLVSVEEVVDWLRGGDRTAILPGSVAITFDDAPDWDYYDFAHPDVGGCLKSFYRLLVEHIVEQGQRPARGTAAVSFAIADPESRIILDRVGMAGRGHWRDSWWAEAAATGVIGIANHSWDHTHPALPSVKQREQRKGTFFGIDNERDADAQVTDAQRLIWYRSAGQALPYFAYPYGEAPPYLVNEYFPAHTERHRIVAAFGTQGEYAMQGQNIWHIPRFVCGQHWKSSEQLEVILRGSLSGSN